MVHFVVGEAQERAQLNLHESMPLWLSIQRVGIGADAQERSPVPLRDSSEDLSDLDLVEDSPADECSQGSSAHGQDDGDADSDEHGGSDSSGKTPLDGATSLVAMFGTGWLNSKVFNVLYNRVAKRPVYLDKASLTAVNNFKRALCKERGKDAYDWNRNLSANLDQLAVVRRHLAEHHETLSGDDARRCLWKWIYNFRLNREQRELRNKQQRSIFNTILHRELGCQHRAQEVVKFGAAGLANDIIAEGEEAVLDRFIAYICRIEKAVDEKRQRGRDLESRQRTGRGDAQERAHSPHDEGTKPNSKGAPPICAYEQPAKGKGKGAKNKHGTPDRGCRDVVHPPYDKKMKPKSRGSPSIPTHVPEQHAQGKGKGAKDKQESVGRGCQDVRKTSWKGTGDADAAKRKRRGREDNDKRADGRVQKRHHLESFTLSDEDLEADRPKHVRKRAL